VTSATQAAEAFARLYGAAPKGVWSAPGRVNLIGEHTDYNAGFVLPFALPHRIAVAARPREDGMLTVATVGDDDKVQQAGPVRVAGLEPGTVSGWAAYPTGVAWVLRENGVGAGADMLITSGLPAGAGLSSSHALQCAVALALLGLAGRDVGGSAGDPPTRGEIARWVQRSENEFVGAPTGLLDQTASLCCRTGNVLFYDVRSGRMEHVPFDIAPRGLEILVIDTRVSHAHSESGYAARRQGCERAAALLGVPALRDVASHDLDNVLARLPEQLRPLVRHVVTENERVLATVRRLRDDRPVDIGPLLTASHESLRDDYRVSCPELDVAVSAALDSGALGARMTGGGFGGSAIALVTSGRRDAVEQAVTAAFADHGMAAPRIFAAHPSAGAGRDM
jgi:galactokinase